MSRPILKKVSRAVTLNRLETVSAAVTGQHTPLDAAFAAVEAATDDPVAMAAAQATLRQLLAFAAPEAQSPESPSACALVKPEPP